jgi:hypothetical protein
MNESYTISLKKIQFFKSFRVQIANETTVVMIGGFIKFFNNEDFVF